MRKTEQASCNPYFYYQAQAKKKPKVKRKLMEQRCPTLPDPTPKGFIFSAEDCPRGTAEDLWPGVFSCHNAYDARQAATAS